MKRSLLTSVSVLALTFAAAAADLPVRRAPVVYKAPAAAPVWTWAGFYIGINGGGIWQRAKAHVSDPPGNTGDATVNSSGGTFGGQAGFNWQYQQYVYGIEVDGNWADASGSANIVASPTFAFSSKLSSLATVRGRVGIAMSSTMIYATGGFAAGHVNNQVPVLFGGYFNNKTRTGWTAGGGIEHMFAEHWSAKAEALYVDLGTSTVQGVFGNGYVGRFTNTAVVGRIGLNYKW
jgi:outer membrane immunogenic protein